MCVARGCALAGLAAALLAGCAPEGGNTSETGTDLRRARYGHTATALPDGRVVIVGGVRREESGSQDELVDEIEVYDPAIGDFRIANTSSKVRRAFHAAAFSDAGTPGDPSDDFVLVGGGLDEDPDVPSELTRTVVKISTATFEVDQAHDDLPHEELDLQAAALGDGRVAFFGGRGNGTAGGNALGEVTIFDATGMDGSVVSNLGADERWNHRMVFVPNGRQGFLFITGGRDQGNVTEEGLVYDVETKALTTFTMPQRRQLHTLTFLDNGTPLDLADDAIVETGGLKQAEEDLADPFRSDDGDTESVVLYRLSPSGSVSGARVGSLPHGVFFHAAAAAASGTAVVVAGGFSSLFFDEDEFYTADFIDSNPVAAGAIFRWSPAQGTLGATNFKLERARAMNALVTLADGSVLVTGGINDDLNSVRGAETVSP